MTTRLREIRENMYITQAELAARAGVTAVTVSRLERGRHRPRFATVRKIAQALGVEPQALVNGNGR